MREKPDGIENMIKSVKEAKSSALSAQSFKMR